MQINSAIHFRLDSASSDRKAEGPKGTNATVQRRFITQRFKAHVEAQASLARKWGQFQEADVGDGQSLSTFARAPSIAALALVES
jgi:hypothetical protein